MKRFTSMIMVETSFLIVLLLLSYLDDMQGFVTTRIRTRKFYVTNNNNNQKSVQSRSLRRRTQQLFRNSKEHDIVASSAICGRAFSRYNQNYMRIIEDETTATTTTTMLFSTTSTTTVYDEEKEIFEGEMVEEKENNDDDSNNDSDDYLLCPSSYYSQLFSAPNIEITYKNNSSNESFQMLPLQKYYSRRQQRAITTTSRRLLRPPLPSSPSESLELHLQFFDVCNDIPSLDFIYNNINRFKYLTVSSRSLLDEYYDKKNISNITNTNTNTNIVTTTIDSRTTTKDHSQIDDTEEQEQEERSRIRSKIRAEYRAMAPLIPHRTLQILYCDEHICVVNKPSGVLSVPGHRRNPSLANLVYDTILINENADIDVDASTDSFGVDNMIVHRLDMATSGILVYALTKEALSKLHVIFRNRNVQKTYHALVEGHLTFGSSSSISRSSEGEIDVDMERDPNNPPYMRVAHPRKINNTNTDTTLTQKQTQHKFWRQDPKPSLTTWTVLSYEYQNQMPVTRIELRPHTGRTHQLRVHTSQVLGSPIVGDDIYGSGGRSNNHNNNLCLHAQRLCINHPISGAEMIFEADPPF